MKAEMHIDVHESKTTSGKNIIEIRCLDDVYKRVKAYKSEVMNSTNLARQMEQRRELD
jgi:hypothetical protein